MAWRRAYSNVRADLTPRLHHSLSWYLRIFSFSLRRFAVLSAALYQIMKAPLLALARNQQPP